MPQRPCWTNSRRAGSVDGERMSYQIEFFALDKWNVSREDSRGWCVGYMEGRSAGFEPHVAMRVVNKANGKVVAEQSARETYGVGMVAGGPSIEQLEDARAKLELMIESTKRYKDRK